MKLTKTAVLTLTTFAAAAIGAGTRFLTGSKILDPSQRLSAKIAGAAALVSLVLPLFPLVLECRNKPTKEVIAEQPNGLPEDDQSKGGENGAKTDATATPTTGSTSQDTTQQPLLDKQADDLEHGWPGQKTTTQEQKQKTPAKPCTQSTGFFIAQEVAAGGLGVTAGFLCVAAMGLATSTLGAGLGFGAGVVTMAGAGLLYRGYKKPCKKSEESKLSDAIEPPTHTI